MERLERQDHSYFWTWIKSYRRSLNHSNNRETDNCNSTIRSYEQLIELILALPQDLYWSGQVCWIFIFLFGFNSFLFSVFSPQTLQSSIYHDICFYILLFNLFFVNSLSGLEMVDDACKINTVSGFAAFTGLIRMPNFFPTARVQTPNRWIKRGT